MPFGGLFLGRSIAFALDSAQMENARAFHVANVGEHLNKFLDIMTVKGTEIPDIQPFEYILLAQQERFETVVESEDGTTSAVADQMQFSQNLINTIAPFVISGRSVYLSEVRIERANVIVNRHVVVVEDDKEVVGGVSGIVDALEGQAAAD